MASSSKRATSGRTSAVKAPTLNKRIIIAAGSKGSSGKSTILINLIEWLRRLKSEPALVVFDPDTSHKTLTRALHPAVPSGLRHPHKFVSLDWRNTETKHLEIDKVVRELCAEPPPVPVKPGQTDAEIQQAAEQARKESPVISIMDGVANQMTDVLFWSDEIHLFDELGPALGFRVTILLCVNNSRDTAEAAKEVIDRVGPNADYIIVRNLKHGGTTLPYYDGAGSRERILNEFGGGEITFDALPEDVKLLCEGVGTGDDTVPCSIWEAAKLGDLITSTRALSRWNVLDRQFRRCAHLLLTRDHYEALLKSENDSA